MMWLMNTEVEISINIDILYLWIPTRSWHFTPMMWLMNTEVGIFMSCHHTCKFNIFDRLLCSKNGLHIVPLFSILTSIDPSFCPCTDPENSIRGLGVSWQCFFFPVINIHVFHRGWFRPPLRPNGSNCFSRGVRYQNIWGNLQPLLLVCRSAYGRHVLVKRFFLELWLFGKILY